MNMPNSTAPIGRPIVRGNNGSKATLHCRVPEEMKGHWTKFVEKDFEFENLTDLVIETLNEKTGFTE
jgi:hypothetical protein